MKIAITREIPQIALENLKKQFPDAQISVHEGPPMSPEELVNFVKDTHAILSLLTDKMTAEVMDAAGETLKIISNYAVGYDNIDVGAATERGIVVSNTPGVLNDAVAEHSVALMMAVARHLVAGDKFTREGKYKYWEPMLMLGPQLSGKTLGIVGLGRIGHQVAKILTGGFNMRVIYYDIKRDDSFETEFKAVYSDLDGLLDKADFVTIHVPLLPSTHHLIGEKEFRRMKPNAILVNTSRGPVVDEVALVQALKEKRIMGAGIDVFENEPQLTPGLVDLDNIIMTPHIASASKEARIEMANLASGAIIDVLANHKLPENLVNKDVKPRAYA